jgi:vancomycin resistance protein VanJ
MPSLPRVRHIIKRLIRAAVVGYGLLANTYLALHMACGDCIAPLALTNHIAHWLLLPSLPGVVLLIVARPRRWQVVWLLPAVIAFGGWYGRNFVPWPRPTPQGETLTVATFNTYSDVGNANAKLATIRAVNADLIGLQEVSRLMTWRIPDALAIDYPYQVVRDNRTQRWHTWSSLVLLSRYPFRNVEEVYFPRGPVPDPMPPEYIRAEVVVQQDPELVYVVYVLHAPYPPFTVPIMYERDEARWTLHPLTYDDSNTVFEMQAMAALLERETLPTILLCDCNSTPRSRGYAAINAVATDAFGQVGVGFGNTLEFPQGAPYSQRFIRIDYVWVRNGVRPVEARVWPYSGTSDHYPVMVTLDLGLRAGQ